MMRRLSARFTGKLDIPSVNTESVAAAAESIGAKINDGDKSAAISKLQDQFADVSPKELSGLLGGEHSDDDSDTDDDEVADSKQFVKKLLKVLVPTPTNLADLISEKTVTMQNAVRWY